MTLPKWYLEVSLTKKLSNSTLPRPTQNFLIQILNLAQFQLFRTKNAEKIASSRGILDHSGSENLKNSRPKKLVKSNKSIFAISKMTKINFWTGKKFKTAKNAISRKIFWIYLISRVFFAWTFINFLGCCEYVGIEIIPKYFYVLTVNISS